MGEVMGNGYTVRISFWSNNVLQLLWWGLYSSVNILKAKQLYILNEWIAWHVDYLSRKLLIKKKGVTVQISNLNVDVIYII